MSDLGIEQKYLAPKETAPISKVGSSYTYFADGDLLLAKITPCFENGKLGIAVGLENGVGFGSSEFFVLRPAPALDREFLYYFLSQPKVRENGRLQMGGAVGQQRVPKEYIEGLCIPLPPLPEQRRIVARIEELFSRLDAGVAALRHAKAQLKRYRQSVLAAATSGRLTEDWRGEGASDWVTLRADDVCAKVQSGGTPKAGFTETSGIPFLKVYNIVNQRIDFEYRPQFVHPDVHAGELGNLQAYGACG